MPLVVKASSLELAGVFIYSLLVWGQTGGLKSRKGGVGLSILSLRRWLEGGQRKFRKTCTHRVSSARLSEPTTSRFPQVRLLCGAAASQAGLAATEKLQ